MSIISIRSQEDNILHSLQNMLEQIFRAAKDIQEDVISCNKMRDVRKLIEKNSSAIVKFYIESDEFDRSDMEDNILNLKNRARLLNHKIKNNKLEFKHSVTRKFVLRETYLFIEIFSKIYDEISSHTYSKPALTLPLDNPLTIKVLDTWGELSFKDC